MTTIAYAGSLRKLRVEWAAPVRYTLDLGGGRLELNSLLGATIQLVHSGAIHCIHCGRATRKSFSQGYCYPCFKRLAACDTCIVSPDRCHYEDGTCREPAWAEAHCHQPHLVYLANSSGLKVGITRATQVPTRWIDQGATQALPVLAVATRQQAGLVEKLLKAHVADRTNWRAMLKGPPPRLDLCDERDRLLGLIDVGLHALRERFGVNSIQGLAAAPAVDIDYPVLQYPAKIATLDFEKNPVAAGTLLGIKGQYLMLDSGVINLRKFTAYEVSVSTAGGSTSSMASPTPLPA